MSDFKDNWRIRLDGEFLFAPKTYRNAKNNVHVTMASVTLCTCSGAVTILVQIIIIIIK